MLKNRMVETEYYMQDFACTCSLFEGVPQGSVVGPIDGKQAFSPWNVYCSSVLCD